ncbi:protein kinase domain-containing protein [Polyangium spumosum]|uniref:protein kinase domain-containing protein n=1 Tax=Polyangium spumosum TaxID=889282 RepID=UPI00129A621C
MQLPSVSEELSRRFVIRRCLGQGGFGVVYEAFDRSLGSDVALKALLSMDPAALYAFKQEFRALADVAHENLVGLHELFFDDGRFYLTMELVRGVSFLRHVRPNREERSDASAITLPPLPTAQRAMAAELETVVTMDLPAVAGPHGTIAMTTLSMDGAAPPRPPQMQPDARGELDVDRLRHSLVGLAKGVSAIHRTGRVHRDLKPSNVLVTPEGRVKILDFGLVGSFESLARDRILVVGTPAYMSPEQATGASGDGGSDWYSVGVMLFEALTGVVPHLFEGTSIEDLLYAKHLVDPPDPREIAPDAPEDLAELALRLLARDPGARAGAEQVFRVGRAATESAPRVASMTMTTRGARPSFVGRARETAAMREAFEAFVREKQPVVLHVHGTSGMGKSDLVRSFLDGLGAQPIVLEGRCHEREWVPYKAFDGAIDALARFLGEFDPEDRLGFLPPGLSSLARLFPVLGRLAEEGSEPEAPDPHELRRRAFEALRKLFVNLAQHRPLVLYLDDLQWADADSAALLEALLVAPAPNLFLVASYRTEEARGSELVGRLPSPRAAEAAAEIEAREVVVGPLSTEDAEALALSILGSDDAEARRAAARIAREAAGSPFFVQELARYLLAGHTSEGLDMRGVVAARVALLPAHARLVLEIVSTAGRPIEPVLIKEAAALGDEENSRAIAALRAEGLLRAKGGRDEARVEAYHDKIRESVVQGLADEVLRDRHRALGHAMEGMSNADPEALAMHFRTAGEPSRARAYMERAAQRAERVLAFDRAATLYRLALELAEPADVGALELRLGDALAKAGRGAEAANVFLSAASKLDARSALVPRQRAAEHLLRAGHMDEGLAAARELLPAVGLRYPATPRRAFVNVAVARVKQRLRGYDFHERPEHDIDPAVLHRIDLCWSLGNGLGGVDAVRGADFQARHLALSLEAGEPYRIARAFSWEAVLRSLGGGAQNIAEARELAARAEAIARRIEHPHALAWSSAARALAAHNGYEFREAIVLCERTIDLFREACSNIAWEIASMYAWWLLTALFYVGDLRALLEHLPRCFHEADALGDRYMETALGAFMGPIGLLLQDRPHEAIASAERALAGWTTRGFHTIHWGALYVRAGAWLQLGEGSRAYAHVHARLGELHASMLPRTAKAIRLRLLDLQARVALARARDVADPEPLFREALSLADRLDQERTSWSDACALAIRAAILVRRGDVDRALAYLLRAGSAFRRSDLDFFARLTERRVGELEGGEAGRARIDAVDTWFCEQGVLRPDRLVPAFLAV